MKFKNIIAGFLAVATVSASCGSMAFAADATINAGIGDAEAAPGGTFSIDVNLADIPDTGLCNVDFAVKFDSTAVTITGVSEGTICKTGAAEAELKSESGLSDSILNGDEYSCFDWNKQTNGDIAMMWATSEASNYWIKDDGVFATITGTVNADVAAGTKIPFEIVPVTRESYPGSTANADVNFCYTDASDNVLYYASKLTAGTLTVTGSSETTSETPSDVVYGDVNGDTKVNILDVAEFCKVVGAGNNFADAKLKANADCVKDGNIDMKDALAILQFITKSITSLPVSAN